MDRASTVRWAGSADEEITTARLVLTPLRPEDADEMIEVLGDERLHEFIGGSPPADVDELRERYQRLAAGSPNVGEVWLNWIVRAGGPPVGTVQVTLVGDADRWIAHVAWVIGVESQGRGYASEAASALVAWLRRHGVTDVVANIHPDHQASETVARQAGLRLTSETIEGEQVWRLIP